MSVCDEGWDTGEPTYGQCPALEFDEHLAWCALGYFPITAAWNKPTTCPFASILRALPTAEIHYEEVEGWDTWVVSVKKPDTCPTCGGKERNPHAEVNVVTGESEDEACPTCGKWQRKGE
jgi:hypothetical protein